ncbi:hypothetical protein [Streptomyces jumonjinensis]|uniref:Uncharacterized protein n=1 Tax=Streptomyces jumonjinensis TaxID=1945 RepID=A0A646KBM4_STRJU|nr:hypothetical protein [Streptomyces jumonjinensis]MQS99688.1 hypothetical protein [Streptomyces jumonjinensis]
MSAERVATVWTEHSETGHRHEELLADGTLIAWTEPPFGETVHPGDDDPDHNPICACPGTWPAAFCLECAGCAACAQCPCVRPRPLGDDRP